MLNKIPNPKKINHTVNFLMGYSAAAEISAGGISTVESGASESSSCSSIEGRGLKELFEEDDKDSKG